MVRGVGPPEGKLQNRSEVNINPHASMYSVAWSGNFRFAGIGELGSGPYSVCVCVCHQASVTLNQQTRNQNPNPNLDGSRLEDSAPPTRLRV